MAVARQTVPVLALATAWIIPLLPVAHASSPGAAAISAAPVAPANPPGAARAGETVNLGKLIDFRTSGPNLILLASGGRLRVSILTPEIVRVQAALGDAEFPATTILLPARDWKPVPYGFTDLGDRLEIRTSALEIDVDKSPLRVDFYDAHSHPLSLDSRGPYWTNGAAGDMRIVAPDEQFYGFGLQFHSFQQRGLNRLLKTNADVPRDTGEGQAVAPFFVSTGGYGLFLNTTGYSRFAMASDDPALVSMRSPDSQLDYVFMQGPSLEDVVSRYALLTGRMRMPPRWALGFWYRARSDWNAGQVESAVSEFRRRGLPCDVVGLEPGWQTHAYPCTFVWNRSRFPDPQAFIQRLLAQNIHLNLWEHAYTSPDSPIWSVLKDAHAVADQKVWGGAVPDFSLERAIDLFTDFQYRDLASQGIAGFKLDEDDGSDYTGGWFFPDSTRFPSGMSGGEIHNVFGFLYQKAMQEMYDRRNLRTFLLSRGGYTGSQGYPVAAYSDYYGFPEYVRALCNSGFTGLLWCPEVRTGSEEELCRRLEVAFLSPLAMMNSWESGLLPWEKGPRVESVFRKYGQLRSELGPELYDAFWRDHQDGLPPVRPLVMEFPEDAQSRGVDDEYVFGGSLLVAPVLSGTERSVYLPTGNWIDLWTGERIQGGRSFMVHAPVETLPLYVPEGGMLAWSTAPTTAPGSGSGAGGASVTETLQSGGTIHLRLYPGERSGKTTIYNDDGVSTRYLAGSGSQTSVELGELKGGSLAILVQAPRGHFTPAPLNELDLYGLAAAPAGVKINHHTIAHRMEYSSNGPTAPPALAGGWIFDATEHCLRIPVERGKRSAVVVTGVTLTPTSR